METLPLDILLNIIDLLAGGDGEDIKSLQILSRTCKYMVPLCRKYLFSSLNLHSKLISERFSDLLSKNPDIARYVTSLDYGVDIFPISGHELNIFDMLKKRSSLRSIGLRPLSYFGWNYFPESTRSSLIFLIQLPTVTHLSINQFKGFPATALSGCGNLIHLQLGRLILAPPEVDKVISRRKIPSPVSLYIGTRTYGLAALLNSASLYAGGPIVDFSRLQKAEIHVPSPDDIDQVNELIRVTTRLEYLKIDVKPTFCRLAGLGESLAINSYRTLKFLNLIITAEGHNPLCGLSRELRFITGNNILEELKLFVMVIDHETETEDWSALDSVLTDFGAFPILHRVSVDILWFRSMKLARDGMNLFIESFKKDNFPRLVESKAVKFNFRMMSRS